MIGLLKKLATRRQLRDLAAEIRREMYEGSSRLDQISAEITTGRDQTDGIFRLAEGCSERLTQLTIIIEELERRLQDQQRQIDAHDSAVLAQTRIANQAIADVARLELQSASNLREIRTAYQALAEIVSKPKLGQGGVQNNGGAPAEG